MINKIAIGVIFCISFSPGSAALITDTNSSQAILIHPFLPRFPPAVLANARNLVNAHVGYQTRALRSRELTNAALKGLIAGPVHSAAALVAATVTLISIHMALLVLIQEPLPGSPEVTAAALKVRQLGVHLHVPRQVLDLPRPVFAQVACERWLFRMRLQVEVEGCAVGALEAAQMASEWLVDPHVLLQAALLGRVVLAEGADERPSLFRCDRFEFDEGFLLHAGGTRRGKDLGMHVLGVVEGFLFTVRCIFGGV